MRRPRIFAAGFVAAFVLCVCAVPAFAGPLWRMDSFSATTAAPGSTLRYIVEPRNIGDVQTDGSPITIRASLPQGMTVISASVFEFGVALHPCTAENGVDPAFGERRIVCTNSGILEPQRPERFNLSVAVGRGVAVGTTLQSDFAVAGGGGGRASTIDTTQIGPPPGFGVEAFDGAVTGNAAGDPFTQAGGHPYAISTTLDFNSVDRREALIDSPFPVEGAKNVLVDLPPGLLGDPTAAAQCSLAQLANAEGIQARPLCSPASQIGTTIIRFRPPGGSSFFGPLPVFNVTPPPNVPARFGFAALGTLVVLDAEVRGGGDYGVTVAAHNVPEALGIAGTTVTIWGVPADPSHDAERACPGQAPPFSLGPTCVSGVPPRAFVRNPTSCPDPGVGVPWGLRVDSWVHPGAFAQASFVSHNPLGYPLLPSRWGAPQGPTGCANVPFDPKLAGGPAVPAKTGSPSAFAFDVSVPQSSDPNVPGQSDLRTAVVTLPEGVRVSPSSAHGLGACTPAQIHLHDNEKPSCPDNARVGSVTIETPLLPDPLSGSVYLAAPHDNPFSSLLAVYITASGPGVELKVAGQVSSDPFTGQLTTTVNDSPQLPFSRLHLEFNGGPNAPLATPRQCGTYSTVSELTGWNGKIVPTRSDFTLSHDGNGGLCPPPKFAPTFLAGTENPVGGRASPLHLRFTRDEEDEEIAALTVNMPNGLTGRIANVDLCPEAAAKAGTCPESSRVGRVTVGAGAGSDPFYIDTGRAYLTGPYKGAPFGAVIVAPAVAGPFDLGDVVVRSSVFVDKHTAEVRIVSDPLPRILEGIPLDVRDVRVVIDKPDFWLNPTSCAKKTISSVLTSTEGKTANVSSRFQVGECASLQFKPRMVLSVGSVGHTGRNATIPLTTTLTMPPAQANIRSVRVTLPTTINARLTVINRACTRAVYEAGRCEAARAGTAVANTPLLRDPLHGNVYFVKNGHPIPDLFIALRGQVDFDLIGKVSIPGGTHLSTTFDAVPDVPVKSFTLKLFAGARGTVGAATNLCSSRGRNAKAELDMIGQNSTVLQADQRLNIQGCSRKAKKSRRGGGHRRGR